MKYHYKETDAGEITIYSHTNQLLATITFWADEDESIENATENAKLIVDALNAFRDTLVKFTINGTAYLIDEFPNGWGWSNDATESKDFFLTAHECQQDAMSHAAKQSIPTGEDNYLNETNQSYSRRDFL